MLQRRESPTGVVYYASPLLEAAGARHAFSTRIGGISDGPFASLNLGNPLDAPIKDAPSNIEENFARLQRAIGCETSERCRVHQVHGRQVLRVRAGESFENGQRADALVSDDPRRILEIRVADCVPILIASEDGRFVGAVHAGWRGVVEDVVDASIRALRELTPLPLRAAIGPCISRCAFEVGPEVLARFSQLFGDSAPIEVHASGKGLVDLRVAVEMQLRRAGVSRIESTDRCTVAHVDEFFSHRRDNGQTGRMAALIAPVRR